MELPVSQQTIQAALALTLGAGLGVIYDLLRALRRLFRGGFAAAVLDLAFWSCAAFVLFAFGLASRSGTVRLFMLGFAAIGAWLYAVSLSPPLSRVLCAGAAATRRGASRASVPVRRGAKKSAEFSKKHFKKLWKCCTINGNGDSRFRRRGKTRRNAPEVVRNEAQAGRIFY